MRVKDFDAIIYIRQPPSYSFEDGLFHVCYPIGANAQAQFVMQPSVFLKAHRAAERASKAFQERDGSVSEIRGKASH